MVTVLMDDIMIMLRRTIDKTCVDEELGAVF